MNVLNPIDRHWMKGTAGKTLVEKPGVKMIEWLPDGWDKPISVIVYEEMGDIGVMSPMDWQGAQPKCAEDIPYMAWLNPFGQTCAMLDGWPVVIISQLEPYDVAEFDENDNK